MVDNVAITAGSGTTIAADDVGAGVLVQRVKATWGPDGTANDTDVATGKPMPVQLRSSTGTDLIGTAGTASAAVITVQGIASGTVVPISVASIPTHAVTVASGGVASGAIASGAVASGAFASGSIASGAMVDLGAIADAAVTAGATGSLSAKLRSISRDIVANIVLAAGTAIIGKVGIDQTTDGTTNKVAADLRLAGTAADKGSGTGGTATQRVIIDSAQLGSLGQTTMSASAPVTLASDQTGLNNRAIIATVTTLTRPANTTAYTAGDSISNNATAGSVTALSATVSDTNDAPVFISELLVTSTDTGLAGKRIRAYLYNADPTASSGVSGGDNAAFSNKINGYVGSFSGRMEAGFSDGTVGRLVPSFQLAADTTDLAGAPANGFVVTLPTSGAKTVYVQFQAIDAFTPSANSTTIIAKVKGWQARAA